MANWGIHPAPEEIAPRDRARRALDTVVRLVGTLRRESMGGLCSTSGSQALSAWRHGRVGSVVYCHDDERALGLELDAYYSGRCECFHLGALPGRIWHLDVSAMYPFCYTTERLPCVLAGYSDDIGESDCELLSERYALLADVTVSTGAPDYPYRDPALGCTVWPVGTFRTALCGPELWDAAERRRVVAWHRASWYTWGRPLRPFGELILKLRSDHVQEADLLGWTKSLGVCVVGKLGQRDRRWVDAPCGAAYPPWLAWHTVRPGGEIERWRSVAGHAQREESGGWSHDSCPQIAAWVTALARARLLALLRCAGEWHYYYCDTDSVMVDEVGRDRLESAGWIREGEPGYLRVVRVSERVHLRGIKSYTEDGRDVMAGRPMREAQRAPFPGAFWRHQGVSGAFREQSRPEAARVAQPCEPGGLYRHGRRLADGRVEPLVYGGAM